MLAEAPRPSRGPQWGRRWPWLVFGLLLLLLVVSWAALWLWNEPIQDGQPVSYWIAKLGTSGIGSEAALDKMDPKKTVPYLLRAIKGDTRQETALKRIYRGYYGRIPSMFRTLLPRPPAPPDPNQVRFVQSRAGYYLATVAKKHGTAMRGTVSELVPLLESSAFETRFGAAAALSGFGTNAAPAIPVIERILNGAPEKFHDIMLHALESCGAEARLAVPTLRRCLSHSNVTLRIQAARTLSRVDPSQRDAVRAVARELLVANSAGTRMEAASLVWEIDNDPAPVVPVLIGLLKERDHPFAYRTIRLLKQIGPGAREAIPALEGHMRTSTRREPFFLKAAEDALAAMSGAISNAPAPSP